MRKSSNKSTNNIGRTPFELYWQNDKDFDSKINRPKGWKFRLSQSVCVLLIFCFLTVSTPAAPRTIMVGANELYQDARFSILSSHLGANIGTLTNNFLLFFFGGKRKPKIQKVEILPGDITIQQGETVDFTAVAYDYEGEPIYGLGFKWSFEKTGKVNNISSLRNGRFSSNHPGEYKITAETEDGFQGEAKVKVEENIVLMKIKQLKRDEAKGKLTESLKKLKKEEKYESEQIDTKKVYQPKKDKKSKNQTDELSEGSILDSIYGWFFGEKRPHGPNAESAEYNNISAVKKEKSSSKSSAMMVRPADEIGWDDNNWWMADDPGNQTGNPPGSSPDAGAGNGNFQLSVPVVNLPGRGIDVNLSLNYNSRLWSKTGSKMSYDSDQGFPAPGWSLGFGKLMFMGSSGGCMMVDADGTRRGYTGSVSNYSYGSYSSTSFTGQSTDGTFIDYNCFYSSSTYGKSLSGQAKLSNGTIIDYGSPPVKGDQAFPTRITDAQGNYITITYRNNRGPEINTVTDTMGRIITFNYDSSNRLISVSVPQLSSGTRTAIQLHYKQITLSPGFAYGYTVDTPTYYPYVIDAIYYPGTATGYWFNDSDSYSSYGMIAKVKEMRGMTSTGTATDQGTVTAGTMSKEATYNYPLTADYNLTDAPTYTELKETWAGIEDPNAPAITNYQINFNSSPRTITVTQPNGLKSKQYMYNNSGQWNDGLIYMDETLDAGDNIISKSVVTWEQGSYSSPRPVQTEVTDERNQTLKTVNAYGTNYNQLTSAKEYDYDGYTLIKETKNTYENNSNYLNRHIFNLVKSTEVVNSSNVRLARIDYEYDNNIVNGTNGHNLQPAPNVIMHLETSDPYTTETNEVCDYYTYNYPECGYDGEMIFVDDGWGNYYMALCIGTCQQYSYYSVYDWSSAFRGNLTKTTSYADAQNLTGAVTETRTYDITGNMVSSSSSCCELNTVNYSSSTQYAYPTSQTRGSASAGANQNTASAVYDYNTGVVLQSTDVNGRTDTSTYDANTLRPIQQTLSTGAYTQYTYNESAMTVTAETKESNGATAGKSIQYLNGIGQVIKEEILGDGVWNIVETKYTNMGQVWKQSNPYRSGQTVYWSENFYDIQGRTTKLQGPDGSYSQAFYNETTRPSSASTSAGQTTRVVDAWGRERWGRYNAQGNLAEVVEPDPNGNGSVTASGNMATTYSYDALGRLIQTNQGGQIRSFKYDDLSRLTRQKLAEQTATINDAGQYVGAYGSGAVWSQAFTYDDRSNVTQSIDARGVKTNYKYTNGGSSDPLNRLQEISYDKTGADTTYTIHDSTPVSFYYMTTGDKTRVSIAQTWYTYEENSYDAEGRLSEYKVTYQQGQPLTTNYLYDTTNRLTEIRYPAQYGVAGSPRKTVNVSYDQASRLKELKVDNQIQMNQINYNEFGAATSINIGASTSNPITETYSFDIQTGLMTN